MKTTFFVLLAAAFAGTITNNAWGQDVIRTKHLYKETPQAELTLHVFSPADQAVAPRPAMVFFHGGGWNQGHPSQFFRQATHLAERGMVGVSVQYRLKNEHGTTPLECVQDAVSAMRWVYAHAEELGIDPQRIGAGGGSAGGHLAAVTTTLANPDLEDPADDAAVDFRPAALVLFNPVFDNGPDGYAMKRLGDHWKDVSPIHNLHKGMPPTLVLLGDQDKLIPVSTAEAFRDQMRELGVRSELVVYPGQPHGFFNKVETGMFQATVQAMDDFLVSLGWLEPLP